MPRQRRAAQKKLLSSSSAVIKCEFCRQCSLSLSLIHRFTQWFTGAHTHTHSYIPAAAYSYNPSARSLLIPMSFVVSVLPYTLKLSIALPLFALAHWIFFTLLSLSVPFYLNAFYFFFVRPPLSLLIIRRLRQLTSIDFIYKCDNGIQEFVRESPHLNC